MAIESPDMDHNHCKIQALSNGRRKLSSMVIDFCQDRLVSTLTFLYNKTTLLTTSEIKILKDVNILAQRQIEQRKNYGYALAIISCGQNNIFR